MAKSAAKVAETLREAMAAPAVRPSLDSFVDHFFILAGGPEAVARMLHDEYTAAMPGSLIRQRILDTILRSLGKTDASSRREDMGNLTDEDLDHILAEREAAIRSGLAVRESFDAPAPDAGPLQTGAAADPPHPPAEQAAAP